MSETLTKHRDERKDNAPVTEKIQIPVHKRGRFAAMGGYNIKKLMAETGRFRLETFFVSVRPCLL